jgi:WD40 repeat protein
VAKFLPEDVFVVVAFGTNEQFLLTRGSDQTAWLGKAVAGEAIVQMPELSKRIGSAAFSQDGRFLLTGGFDRTVRLWDLVTQKPIGEALPHAGEVGTVAFSPDGQTLLTATTEGMFRRWERATGKPVGAAFQLPGETGGESVFSPDGETVLTVYGDGKVWLRDVRTGQRLGPALVHYGTHFGVAFSPDGQRVLTQLSSLWTARWDLLPPVPDEGKRLACWVQVITGMVLEGDAVHVLDAATWNEQRHRLEELGGPPEGR